MAETVDVVGDFTCAGLDGLFMGNVALEMISLCLNTCAVGLFGKVRDCNVPVNELLPHSLVTFRLIQLTVYCCAKLDRPLGVRVV